MTPGGDASCFLRQDDATEKEGSSRELSKRSTFYRIAQNRALAFKKRRRSAIRGGNSPTATKLKEKPEEEMSKLISSPVFLYYSNRNTKKSCTVPRFKKIINDVTRLLDAGMYATAEQKWHVVPFDERFCKTPPLSVLRRITIINEDFTESDQKS